MTECPDGYWGDDNTCKRINKSLIYSYLLKFFCSLACHSTCFTCYGTTATNCLSCNNDRFLYETTCVTECPGGWWGDTSDNTCKRINKSLIYPYLFNFLDHQFAIQAASHAMEELQTIAQVVSWEETHTFISPCVLRAPP